jgi:hypothetical protein
MCLSKSSVSKQRAELEGDSSGQTNNVCCISKFIGNAFSEYLHGVEEGRGWRMLFSKGRRKEHIQQVGTIYLQINRLADT